MLLLIRFNSSVDTVGGFSEGAHELSRSRLVIPTFSSHQEGNSVQLDVELRVPGLKVIDDLVGILDTDRGGTISQQIDGVNSGNSPSSLEGSIDVGTTVGRESLGEVDGIGNVGLSGHLEGGFPGGDGRGVGEDGEFSGIIEVSDGLDEFLFDEVESVGSSASAEGEGSGHGSGDIEEEDDFTGGDTEKVALGFKVIEDLSGFILGGDVGETVDDVELVFDIDDVVLEGSEGIQLVTLEGESDQDGDNLFTGQTNNSVLDEFSQSEHISRVGEGFVQQASLFRSQDLGGGGEGIFSNLEFSIRESGLVDGSDQSFNVSLVPLVLVGEGDDGELFGGNTFSFAGDGGGQKVGGLLLVISAVEAVDNGDLVLDVKDVVLEDGEAINSITFESVGGNEGEDLVGVESERSDGGLEESVSVVSERGTVHSGE